ncbi:hypothetical protein EVAR_48105_1 [Eumeta japonica]|uniref:Uncharacterized protein n=1 Tax=Eumeta variegata TaxID=151549 RepID=A0A4C1XIW5_EUMVA|nr:hypothetical protein EVAR_48105_1 [Eumeta japonica]
MKATFLTTKLPPLIHACLNCIYIISMPLRCLPAFMYYKQFKRLLDPVDDAGATFTNLINRHQITSLPPSGKISSGHKVGSTCAFSVGASSNPSSERAVCCDIVPTIQSIRLLQKSTQKPRLMHEVAGNTSVGSFTVMKKGLPRQEVRAYNAKRRGQRNCERRGAVEVVGPIRRVAGRPPAPP